MRTVRRSHACHCIESPHPCMPSAASKGDASCRVQLSHGNHLSIMLAAAARSENVAQRVERINILRRDADGTCLTALSKRRAPRAGCTARDLPRQDRSHAGVTVDRGALALGTQAARKFSEPLFSFFVTHAKEKKGPGSRCHEEGPRVRFRVRVGLYIVRLFWSVAFAC